MHHWMEIEFRNGVYIVTHPEGSKSFKEQDKLKLLRWIDKFLVGRRKMREIKSNFASLQLSGSDEGCSIINAKER
jgi:hypothetical protein